MEYRKGNLFNAGTDALVNTVNTVGVMGKGIALQFKERFPKNFYAYEKACKEGNVQIGSMFVFKEDNLERQQTIVNFPTKKEWYRKSSYKYIEKGLKDLASIIKKLEVKSIAIPPLGCGNGGLKWIKVKSLIEEYLSDLNDVKIIIYEPIENIKEILQKENRNGKVELTPARAMLLYSLFKYEKFGEYATVFAANKLAYFLQENGENLRLDFTPYVYGPYAQAVEKVLYKLNGKYLQGLEQMTAKPFEALKLNYDRYEEIENFVHSELSENQRERLKDLFKTIRGFESALSLEVLSSVHFVLKEEPEIDKNEASNRIKSWSNRKKTLIKEEYIELAHNRLTDGQQLALL
jgi:O-acetyl-ADP-ribose deacetylase (regulator of RNase III)